jgi:hypothetical protein
MTTQTVELSQEVQDALAAVKAIGETPIGGSVRVGGLEVGGSLSLVEISTGVCLLATGFWLAQ